MRAALLDLWTREPVSRMSVGMLTTQVFPFLSSMFSFPSLVLPLSRQSRIFSTPVPVPVHWNWRLKSSNRQMAAQTVPASPITRTKTTKKNVLQPVAATASLPLSPATTSIFRQRSGIRAAWRLAVSSRLCGMDFLEEMNDDNGTLITLILSVHNQRQRYFTQRHRHVTLILKWKQKWELGLHKIDPGSLQIYFSDRHALAQQRIERRMQILRKLE